MSCKGKRWVSLLFAFAMIFTVVRMPSIVNAEANLTVEAVVDVMPTATAQPSSTTAPSIVPSDDATEPPVGQPGPTETPIVPAPTESASVNKVLENAKKAAKEELRNYLDIDEYTDEDKELIETLLQATEKDINKLTSVQEVKTYVKIAKKVLDDIPTLAELQGMSRVMVKFIKKKVKVKEGKIATLKVKLAPAKGLTKIEKRVKWSINKKGKKVIKFVKKVKKLQGKLVVKLKTKRKGKAKVTCKMPSGRRAICTVVVK